MSWKPGDQPPSGYLAWHAWAEVQERAGLQSKQCVRCELWRYPQEMSKQKDGICNKCANTVMRRCNAADMAPYVSE